MVNLAIILAVWVLTLITLYIGYIVGQRSMSNKPLNLKFPRIIPRKKQKLGAIPKISQIEIEKKGTRLEATEQAMEETLDGIL